MILLDILSLWINTVLWVCNTTAGIPQSSTGTKMAKNTEDGQQKKVGAFGDVGHLRQLSVNLITWGAA